MLHHENAIRFADSVYQDRRRAHSNLLIPTDIIYIFTAILAANPELSQLKSHEFHT